MPATIPPAAPPPAGVPAPGLRPARPERTARVAGAWPLRRSLTVLGIAAVVVSTLMISAGALALSSLSDARSRVIDRIDPAYRQVERLSVALVDQETGVRGYALSGERVFLQPYEAGRQAEAAATAELSAVADRPELALRGNLDELAIRVERWRTEYVEPTVAAVGAGRPAPVSAQRGKQLFDELRVPLLALQTDLDRATATARTDLADAAGRLQAIGVLIAAGLLVLLVVLALGLRRVVTQPISGLAGSVRRVADGDFEARVVGTGPREVVELGDDVDTMRRQIVAELGALRTATERLDQQAQDLERSNTELEQFAYVASHDLQEPLRKVASFTQLLERRYKGQLDDRADQYIAFAVDGAKRMQVLINDLLAFSRVGRLLRDHVEVDARVLVDQALANLSLAIEETGAEVEVDELPQISGDATLLTGVFQNLIGNAVKFRGDAPPRIHVGVDDAGEEWEFRIADNGIGIEPGYADRIFVIFQRLHPKDAYPGTGIGLAMCRKIVEYHGGRIWLDTDVPAGTTFRFTLPKPAPPPSEAPAATTEEPETAG